MELHVIFRSLPFFHDLTLTLLHFALMPSHSPKQFGACSIALPIPQPQALANIMKDSVKTCKTPNLLQGNEKKTCNKSMHKTSILVRDWKSGMILATSSTRDPKRFIFGAPVSQYSVLLLTGWMCAKFSDSQTKSLRQPKRRPTCPRYALPCQDQEGRYLWIWKSSFRRRASHKTRDLITSMPHSLPWMLPCLEPQTHVCFERSAR